MYKQIPLQRLDDHWREWERCRPLNRISKAFGRPLEGGAVQTAEMNLEERLADRWRWEGVGGVGAVLTAEMNLKYKS